MRRFFGKNKGAEAVSIPLPGEFEAMVQKELKRAQRLKGELCQVEFSTPDPNELIRVLKQSKRRIDELGWCKENQVGILLPETSQEGALEYVKRVIGMLEEMGIMDITFTINSLAPVQREELKDVVKPSSERVK